MSAVAGRVAAGDPRRDQRSHAGIGLNGHRDRLTLCEFGSRKLPSASKFVNFTRRSPPMRARSLVQASMHVLPARCGRRQRRLPVPRGPPPPSGCSGAVRLLCKAAEPLGDLVDADLRARRVLSPPGAPETPIEPSSSLPAKIGSPPSNVVSLSSSRNPESTGCGRLPISTDGERVVNAVYALRMLFSMVCGFTPSFWGNAIR